MLLLALSRVKAGFYLSAYEQRNGDPSERVLETRARPVRMMMTARGSARPLRSHSVKVPFC